MAIRFHREPEQGSWKTGQDVQNGATAVSRPEELLRRDVVLEPPVQPIISSVSQDSEEFNNQAEPVNV